MSHLRLVGDGEPAVEGVSAAQSARLGLLAEASRRVAFEQGVEAGLALLLAAKPGDEVEFAGEKVRRTDAGTWVTVRAPHPAWHGLLVQTAAQARQLLRWAPAR